MSTRYSVACKYEAVRRIAEDGRSVDDVAREMGVGKGSLRFWLRRYRQVAPAQVPAAPSYPARSLVAYLRRGRAA